MSHDHDDWKQKDGSCPRLTRRDCLSFATAAAVSIACGQVPRAHAAEQPTSINELAKARGLQFGTAFASRDLDDARYREIARRECGLLVAENEHKWYVLRPNATQFDFARADRLVRFAADHGLDFRGHTLLWHHPRWFPQWLNEYDFSSRPAATAERLLVEHIRTVCGRYQQIRSWDVINETVDERTGELRETVFSKAYGPDIIELAFHAAHEAAPQAQLVYNDYMSWEAASEPHRRGVLRLLERLRSKEVPVHALGVQSHIGSGNSDDSIGFNTAREREWRRFMDEVTGMGLKVLITEFDIHDKNLPADVAVRDREVAAYARAYLDLMLSYRQVSKIVVWGMLDHRSWLQERWPRADRLPKRPTLYDASYRPKALREAIAASLRAAPTRIT